MTTFEELDALPTRELHDRAVKRAERHLDVKFFWRLMSEAPGGRGRRRRHASRARRRSRTGADRCSTSLRHDEDAMEARRPIYIDYLLRHSE